MSNKVAVLAPGLVSSPGKSCVASAVPGTGQKPGTQAQNTRSESGDATINTQVKRNARQRTRPTRKSKKHSPKLRQLAIYNSAHTDIDVLVRERFDTSSLEAQEQALAGQIDVIVMAIEDLITVNARQPLEQDEYQTRFNALTEQHERLLAEHKNIAG